MQRVVCGLFKPNSLYKNKQTRKFRSELLKTDLFLCWVFYRLRPLIQKVIGSKTSGNLIDLWYRVGFYLDRSY